MTKRKLSVDPSPSGLVRFTNRGVPNSYAQQVVSRAVTVPLFGPFDSNDDAAARRKSSLVVDRWRARVSQLHALGWSRAAERQIPGKDADGKETTRTVALIWQLLNCCPSGFDPDPVTYECRYYSLCPHCHGRAALEHWRAIDRIKFHAAPARLLPKPAPRGPLIVDLEKPGAPRLADQAAVSRELLVRVPRAWRTPPPPPASRPATPLLGVLAHRAGAIHAHDLLRPEVKKNFLSRPDDHRALLAAGCTGGIESIEFGFDPAADRYLLKVRQLLFAPLAAADRFDRDPRLLPDMSGFTNASSAIKIHRAPSRCTVMRKVAAALRYSADMLLRADPAVVLAYLEARKGRRLIARFGELYGQAAC